MSKTITARKTQHLPERIELTELEILKGDNIHLRIQEARRQMVALLQEQQEFTSKVEKRLKIDSLERYILDRNSGEGRLARKD